MDYNELIRSFAERYGVQDLSTADGVTILEIDETQVSIIHDEQGDSVTLYGEIGFPPPDAEGAFGSAMLKANHPLAGTGGLVLCQHPDTGAFGVLRTLALATLDMDAFCAELGRLVDQAEYWRKLKDGFLQAEEEADIADTSAGIEPLSPNGFIQV